MSDQQTEWEPSKDQVAYLNAQQDADYGLSVEKAMTESGSSVTRTRWYDWSKDDQFVAWWNEELDRFFSLRRARVIHHLEQSAIGADKDANVLAIKTLLERYDKKYLPASKKVIDGPGDVSYEEWLEKLEEGARLEAEALKEQGPVAAGEDATDGD